MLDAVIVLALLAAFLFAPIFVGFATRSAKLAIVVAGVLTIPAALSQALTTNLPGFAVVIAFLGVIGGGLGVLTASRRGRATA